MNHDEDPQEALGDDPFMKQLRAAAEEREAALRDLASGDAPEDSVRRERNRRGFLATMGDAEAPLAAPAPIESPTVQGDSRARRIPSWAPTLLRAAAVVLAAGAALYGVSRQLGGGAEPVDPGTGQRIDDIRLGGGAEEPGPASADAAPVSAALTPSQDALTLEFPSGTLEDGWYEAELRLTENGEVLARTEEWHVEPVWRVELPPSLKAGWPATSELIWIDLRILDDDGTDEGLERSRWKGPVTIER